MILRIPGTHQWKQELTFYADVLQEYKHRRDNLYHYKPQEEELSALRSIATAGSFTLPRSSWHILSLTFLGQFFDKAGNYFVKRYNLGTPATRQQKALSTTFYIALYLPLYYYSLYSAYTLSQESFVRKDLENGFKKVLALPTPLGKEFESIVRSMDPRHIILNQSSSSSTTTTTIGGVMDYDGASPEWRIATATNLQLKNQWHKAQLEAAAKSRINKTTRALPQVDYDVLYVQQALNRLPWYATHQSTTSGTSSSTAPDTAAAAAAAAAAASDVDNSSVTTPMSSSVSLSARSSPMYEAASHHQERHGSGDDGGGKNKEDEDQMVRQYKPEEGMGLGSVFTTIFGSEKSSDGDGDDGEKEWNNNSKGEQQQQQQQQHSELGRGGSRIKRRRERKRHHHNHYEQKNDREEEVAEGGGRSRSSARLISV
jgi:hypothetical protein